MNININNFELSPLRVTTRRVEKLTIIIVAIFMLFFGGFEQIVYAQYDDAGGYNYPSFSDAGGYEYPSVSDVGGYIYPTIADAGGYNRSEEHTSELQSHVNLVCRLLLEK